MYSSGGVGPRLGLLRRLGPQLMMMMTTTTASSSSSRVATVGPLLLARALPPAASRAASSGRLAPLRRHHTTTTTSSSSRSGGATRTAVTPTTPSQRYYLVLRRGSGLATACSVLAAALALHHYASATAAGCAGGGDGGRRRRAVAEDDDDYGDDVEARLRKALDAALGPLGGEISFGCLVGFTSGYALKKVGKTVAVVIGLTYLAAQTLSSLGYVDVNWKKLERQLMGLLGGKDGDSYKISQRDLEYYWAKLQEALTYQLPSTGGFVTGFAVGFYKG